MLQAAVYVVVAELQSWISSFVRCPACFIRVRGAMSAAPGPASSAVAERAYTWQELQDFAGLRPRQPWRLNNHALKFMRFKGEDPVGVPRDGGSVVCNLAGGHCIKEMEHDVKGPGFSFTSPLVEGKFLSWSPAQFLTELRPDYVENMKLKEHGVRRLEVAALPGSVDTHRLAAANRSGQA